MNKKQLKITEGKCWNCGKYNPEQMDGYFWCNCKDTNGKGSGLHYAAKETRQVNVQRKLG